VAGGWLLFSRIGLVLLAALAIAGLAAFAGLPPQAGTRRSSSGTA
jgi:hypothetical protein